MKNCTKCSCEKQFYEFSKNKRNRDGLQNWCKICMNIARTEWNENNPEKRRIANDSWSQKNPDKVREKSLRWRNKNIERAREISRQWKLDNPEEHARHEQKRRALKYLANQGYFPTLSELIEIYGPGCMYPECVNTDLSVDHIIPLAIGGPHDVDNAQILCIFHNSQKGKRNCIDYRPKELIDERIS